MRLSFVSFYFFITSGGSVEFVAGADAGLGLDLNLARFDLDVAAARFVGGVVQRTDFGTRRLQVGRRCETHFDLVHRHLCT